MSALTPRRPAPPSSRQLLTRVLDQPELITAVRGLPPRALARLIDHVGLDDAGELIALATVDQLEQVFDEDLWRSSRPGQDETFDAARFALWLEVMVEAGAAFAARRLAALPPDLVVLALHHHALVLDLDALALEMAELGGSDDGDAIEKALDDRPYVELDAYRVISRGHDGWDALVAVLVELDAVDHGALERLLERCAALTEREVEDEGGLHAALSAADTLATDVAAAREDRRAHAGYVAPSAATAFLRHAVALDVDAVRREGRDPTTRAYFRELAPRPTTSATTSATSAATTSARGPATADAPAARLASLLTEAGVLDAPPAVTPRLAAGETAAGDAPADAFREALAALADRDPDLHHARLSELVYLANVLVAGADAGGRAFRPAEAADAAVRACGLGLAHLARATGDDAQAILARDGADLLFRIGWRLLRERGDEPARALLR